MNQEAHPKRILHVITSLRTGGAEKLLSILIPQLKKEGDIVELLLFDGTVTPIYRAASDAGIKIHWLRSNPNVYALSNIWRLLKYMKRYDIIHTHNTACQLFVPIAKILSGSCATLITTEHNATNRRRNLSIFKHIDKWMYSRYKKIICIANQTAHNLKEYIGDLSKITIVFNGININEFIGEIITPQDNMPVIITMIAAFRKQKDQDTLVRAMTLLPDNYILRLIGDGERRFKIESLAQSLNVAHRTFFLGDRNDIPHILKESHINVLSSHWEGLSLSSLECMASGAPFIASDVDGLHEIVNRHGILFPKGDYKKLAEEILKICTDPLLYRMTARKCREKAMQYDISKTAALYREIYYSV